MNKPINKKNIVYCEDGIIKDDLQAMINDRMRKIIVESYSECRFGCSKEKNIFGVC